MIVWLHPTESLIDTLDFTKVFVSDLLARFETSKDFIKQISHTQMSIIEQISNDEG